MPALRWDGELQTTRLVTCDSSMLPLVVQRPFAKLGASIQEGKIYCQGGLAYMLPSSTQHPACAWSLSDPSVAL